MICDNCKTDRLNTDFINNQKFCYQCMYRIKLQKESEKQTTKIHVCRICGKIFLPRKDEKKRQRKVYCSEECAEKGHKRQLKNYWTRKVEIDTRGI